MNILVTGGAGFIGSNFVEKLLKRNDVDDIYIIDNLSTGKEENIIRDAKIIFLEIDIRDLKILNDIDIIFHFAALPRVQYSIKNPVETNSVNVGGTLNLLDFAVKNRVKKFIFSSSSSIYGDQKELPLCEDMRPNPMSPYAFQKMASEYYCGVYNEQYGLDVIALRYFNVFGPRQDPSGDYACLIPKFMDQMMKGINPVINGDGNQTRDFTYIDNVVDANMFFGFDYKGNFGEAFNVGTGGQLSVNDVVDELKDIIGDCLIKPKHGPAVKEPRDTRASLMKLYSTGFANKVDFTEGLQKMYDHKIGRNNG